MAAAAGTNRGAGRGGRRAGTGALALCLGCIAFAAEAQDRDRRWYVAPLLGIHAPRLTDLSEGEFKAPLPGRGRLIFDAADAGQNFDFVIDNPLPDISPGTEAGIELGWALDDRNTLVFGASVWESGASSAVRSEIPFQGQLTPVGYERSGRISYFQYFLGVQRQLIPDTGRLRLHGRLTFHEVFDVDYREDLVFGFDTSEGTFKRLIVMESQATGVFMTQIGVGGEYFLRDWLSIGADVGYTVSLRKFKLGNASLTTDIQPEDNLNFRTPAQLDTDRRLRFLAEARSYDDVTYREMELGFDGWRLLIRANLYLR